MDSGAPRGYIIPQPGMNFTTNKLQVQWMIGWRFPLSPTSARAFSHQWTDLTSTQWHTDFTDLTSMEQISPHPNGTLQENESDLANDAIPISTMPLRFAIPEYKTVSCFRCISRSNPNGTLA